MHDRNLQDTDKYGWCTRALLRCRGQHSQVPNHEVLSMQLQVGPRLCGGAMLKVRKLRRVRGTDPQANAMSLLQLSALPIGRPLVLRTDAGAA